MTGNTGGTLILPFNNPPF